MGSANDGLRFLLELGVLASIAYWGIKAQEGAARWLLGLGGPIFVAAIWVTFVNPGGVLSLEDPWRVLLEFGIFGSAVAALAAIGRPAWAAAFAILVGLHLTLTFVLDQR